MRIYKVLNIQTARLSIVEAITARRALRKVVQCPVVRCPLKCATFCVWNTKDERDGYIDRRFFYKEVVL